MVITELSTADVRDQFSAYVDPRFKENKSYDEHSEDFDAWLETVKAEARAEGVKEGRTVVAGKMASALRDRLDEELGNRFSSHELEARGYNTGLVFANRIITLTAKSILEEKE